jgi:hypothetical protein
VVVAGEDLLVQVHRVAELAVGVVDERQLVECGDVLGLEIGVAQGLAQLLDGEGVHPLVLEDAPQDRRRPGQVRMPGLDLLQDLDGLVLVAFAVEDLAGRQVMLGPHQELGLLAQVAPFGEALGRLDEALGVLVAGCGAHRLSGQAEHFRCLGGVVVGVEALTGLRELLELAVEVAGRE